MGDGQGAIRLSILRSLALAGVGTDAKAFTAASVSAVVKAMADKIADRQVMAHSLK